MCLRSGPLYAFTNLLQGVTESTEHICDVLLSVKQVPLEPHQAFICFLSLIELEIPFLKWQILDYSLSF